MDMHSSVKVGERGHGAVWHNFRHEPYGVGGIFGHKFWVSMSKGSTDNDIKMMIEQEKATLTQVCLNGKFFDPSELTFFIYFDGFRPSAPQDNWAANQVITIDLTS